MNKSKKILVHNKEQLKKLILQEIELHGLNCNLNHLDISKIQNLSFLFSNINQGLKEFNGDISGWDVSNVQNMENMFFDSKFNGDISQWNTSNVENMSFMFLKSEFNQDISKWNVSKVKNMYGMFMKSLFNQDISSWDVSNVKDMREMFNSSCFNHILDNWKPLNLRAKSSIFKNCNAPIPYWAEVEDTPEIVEKILFQEELNSKLEFSTISKNKTKI